MDHLSTMQYLVAGALGLGLAACSGFRVFVPLLAASVAHRVGWLPSSPGFNWLSTWSALLMLATATAAELAGYYVPLFDHLLDTLTTPASFIAGTLLMTSSLTHLDPTLRWTLGILVGGGAAGLVQGSTALLRAGSTATTGGLANPLFATLENVLAIVGTLFTLLLPLAAAVAAVGLLVFLASRWRRWRQRRAAQRVGLIGLTPTPGPGRFA